MALKKTIEALNKTQLKALVAYKKRDKDKAIPDTKDELIKQYNATYLCDDILLIDVKESSPTKETMNENKEDLIEEQEEMVVAKI